MSEEFNKNRKYNSDEKESQDIPEQIDITGLIDDLFQGLRRYWLVLLVLVSLCSSISWYYQKSHYTPNYRAYSTFVVNYNSTISYSYDYYNKTAATQIANTFPYIIESSVMQHVIADELGLGYVPGRISASSSSGTNMITLSVDAADGQLAYDILQVVIENYPKVGTSIIGNTELNVLDESGVPYTPTNAFSAQGAARTGFLIGLVLFIGLLVLYSMTRRTIRKESDFKNILNVKCIGVLPRVNFKKRSTINKNQVLISNRRVNYSFIEACRLIRARIERFESENHAGVYMVSSAIAGEGKSTVAANLALSLADKEKGRKVVLLDLDLRNPSVGKTLGTEEYEIGMIDLLKGEATLEQVLHQFGDTQMYFVPGGKPVRSTSSILNDEIIKDLLTKLKETVDYVIVDTPPSSMFTDAAIVGRNVDAGVFVVKQDYAPRDRILEGIEFLTESGIQLVGCVLNYAESGITEYGSSYYYGGRYRYGSGYGKYGKRPMKKAVVEEDENEG